MSVQELCYIIVFDGESNADTGRHDRVVASSCCSHLNATFWYTRSTLESLLQLVGCKVHHAFQISRRVFDILEGENLKSTLNTEEKGSLVSGLRNIGTDWNQPCEKYMAKELFTGKIDDPYENYKKQATVMVERGQFLDIICHCLEEYRYVGPSQRADIILGCRLRERKESVTILLCGTSGCGKSTLSTLLASTFGITTVVSTDSIRHTMRSFFDEKENPLLWASTYHAGEFLDPVAVAETKRKKKAKMLSKPFNGQGGLESARMIQGSDDAPGCNFSGAGQADRKHTEVNDSVERNAESNLTTELVGSKVLAVEGYKAQSEMVIDSLDKLIMAWEEHKESVVIEGVHLSLNFVMGLMKKHPSIIPFLICISDEEKHIERFAIRAKYMTLDPSKNKYVKYISNIRTIQDYLCKRADKHLVPKVKNTNVDRSVASIHSTIFSCLRRQQMGASFYDAATNTAKVVCEEYCKHCNANSISSKGMFRLIQRQGSIRRYMAIVNSDGSVAKAWPFQPVANTREIHPSSAATPSESVYQIYGPVQVHAAEPVNVQFGHFGVGSWLNGTESTSYIGSLNDPRVDGDEPMTQFSSLSSSSLHHEVHAKELAEEVAASESEDEAFQEDEDDSSDATGEHGDEMEGSVAESSTISDEEYEIVLKDGMSDDATTMDMQGLPTNLVDDSH
ncbi:P-loop NTPase domain-containing protein LPA1 homolog 2-like [Macadamia integrifolia]|uniref:P-loop NTPase domain-containing protein LPA1 homolog 2-like n=1 Tax=Macadamia integrifolia TaxID=60698 RepID=UPI001C4E329B|nr:P-loop NTPase domain-containing protein LPA1 homolog 2-like [Macadamia integrifolia]XP_042507174.1 P-loop NTPase domain-containing protein LPA1 homolog 2-like [Macadamia integrifolia]